MVLYLEIQIFRSQFVLKTKSMIKNVDPPPRLLPDLSDNFDG